MSARTLLPVVQPVDRRQLRDQLEILNALLAGPTVDGYFTEDLVKFPPDHPVYGWRCSVPGCEGATASAGGAKDMCTAHLHEYRKRAKNEPELTRYDYQQTAVPRKATKNVDPPDCRVCGHRPSKLDWVELCERHYRRWMRARQEPAESPDFEVWCALENPFPSFGRCVVSVCHLWAHSPLGLCLSHDLRYTSAGRPGGARPAIKRWQVRSDRGETVPLAYDDEAAFRAWCENARAAYRPGQLNLPGLSPLLRAEFQWCLFARSQRRDYGYWSMHWLQDLVHQCRMQGWKSVADIDIDSCNHTSRMIVQEFRADLRLVYFTREDSREAGFIETDHFGIRLKGDRRSHLDLTGVKQKWLRDLLWDSLAGRLSDPRGARSGSPFDASRRAAVELSAFLAIAAPEAGHDPRLLTAGHMDAFVVDQRRRARDRLPSLGLHRYREKKPCICSEHSRREVFNYSRYMLRAALESGAADQIGLSREFICAMPTGGGPVERSRAPFTDDVARALADETNLQRLRTEYDPNDRGVRDIWETLVFTGRRANEVVELRLDCIGRYGGLPLLWHDQTKVGNLDEAIRIPERIFEVIQHRQRLTLQVFRDRHGRMPSTAERREIALFPSGNRNAALRRSISYGWFQSSFRSWVQGLEIQGQCVPHQARHTLATKLLRSGASMHHIKQYMGQISMRMAEHYAKAATSEIEDVLQAVWVGGPGSAVPGRPLSSPSTAEPLSRAEAQAMALDLSRRSTPTEGGFCTFQPVIDGGACPWKLNCEGCDRFVMSGADLLYWRRKRDQWRSVAERAPDSATADYLHQVFEPTARAIDGLERALAGLGLLQEALALDLRRPQDYFQRVWSTAFRASDLASLNSPGEEPSLAEPAAGVPA
ncbi:tyrosine-type recombinase/integrase [Kitasatospora sp. NPDC056446]|uniref:tyrosine-type recombinase/integrase n=1 Tax=Kitasatospora sp. NPDC056446 TaxID=3345819 RepID=UPI0036A382C1